MKKILLIVLLLVSVSYSVELNDRQMKNAKLIQRISKAIPDKKGKTYENTLLLISSQESDLGEYLVGDLKKGKSLTTASIGLFHMRIVTVRELQKVYPNKFGYLSKKSDMWIAKKLMDKEFSALLASYNIKRLADKGGSHFNIVSQWNGGLRNMSYYRAVLMHRDILKVVKNS